MSRRNFQPRSKQATERQVTRYQESFKQGQWPDMPPSEVPNTGLWKLVNTKNCGNYLEGRRGSRDALFGSLPHRLDGLNVTTNITGNERTVIDNDAGEGFLQSHIRDWFILPDGTAEKIIRFINSNTLVTYTSQTSGGTLTGCSIRGRLNAFYQHKETKKIIVQSGVDIYVCEINNVGTWTKAYNTSLHGLNNSPSSINEHENIIIVSNSAGHYVLDINQSDYTYFKANTAIPDQLITNIGDQSDTTPYGYKYTYTLLRMRGFGDVNRLSEGVVVEQESGSNKINNSGFDYATIWLNDKIDETNTNTIGTLTIPNDDISPNRVEHKWTHYSIYRTMDIGDNGEDPQTGVYNNPNLFGWVQDVPVAKSFYGSISGTTFTISKPVFSVHDVGCDLKIYANSTYYTATIESFNSETSIELGGYTGTDAAGVKAAIGIDVDSSVENILTIDQTDDTITVTHGRALTSQDNGKPLFIYGGEVIWVLEVLTGTTAKVSKNITRNSEVCCIDATSRKFTDTLKDYDSNADVKTLSNNIAAFTLQTRFSYPLPNGNESAMVSGWFISSRRNGNMVFYQDIPSGYEYLFGYYRPDGQFVNVKDQVKHIEKAPNKVLIFCKNSTHDLVTSSYSTVTKESINDQMFVLSSHNVLNGSIGAMCYGAVTQSDWGYWFVITNEPELRIFDGSSYVENCSKNRFTELLRELHSSLTTVYDSYNGLIWWGSNE